MKKKMDSMVHKGALLIVLGVFIWLNDSNGWFNWAQFIAIIAVVVGIKKIAMGQCH